MGSRVAQATPLSRRLRVALSWMAITSGCARHPPGEAPPSASTGQPEESLGVEDAAAWSDVDAQAILTEALPVDDGGGSDAGGSSWLSAVRMERWDEAARALDALEGPPPPARRWVRARVALALSDDARAVTLLDRLEEQLPMFASDIVRARAEAQLTAGPFLESARYFEKQSSSRALRKAGVAYAKLAMGPEAKDRLDKAVALARAPSDEIEARRERFRLEAAHPEAKLFFEDARFLALRSPDSKEGRQAVLLLGQWDDSHPFTAREHLARADALADAGKVDEAIAEFALATSARGSLSQEEIDWARAQALYKARGHYAEASRVYDRLGTIKGPRQAEALFYAARSRSRADQDDEARQGYALVARRFKSTSFGDEAAYLGPRLEYLHAKWKEAVLGYDGYLKAFPHGKQRAQATYERAIALLAGGQYAQAQTALAPLAHAESGSEGARLLELLGLACQQSGDLDGAQKAWGAAMKMAPLTWGAMAARSRLLEAGAPLPPLLEPPQPRSDPPFEPRFPLPADMYHRLGLDRDAESYLKSHESDIGGVPRGREKEGLCLAYGQLSRATRLYRIGIDAVSLSSLSKARDLGNAWAWDCLYPHPYADTVARVEQENELPAGVLHAVMRQESAFDPEVVSSAHAVGLLQLLPQTARKVAAEAGDAFDERLLVNPTINIQWGGRYFSKLLRQFKGSVPLAAAAYNAGPKAVTRWIERFAGVPLDLWGALIPYEETRTYVGKVTGNWARYAYAKAGEDGAIALPLAAPTSSKPSGEMY